MQGERKPDPRWNNFIQQFDSKGVAIGFKLQGNQFLFQYDEEGGWVDQKGRLYDADGVLVDDQVQASSQQDENQDDDDQIIDQFEQMLIQQEQGIIRNKSKNQKKQQKPQINQINFQQESKVYLQKLNKNQELREGLSRQIWIFFKMRSNLYQRVDYQAEKKQDLNSRNVYVKQIKAKIQQRRKQLIESNKWLQGEFFLDFSGASLDQGVYDRYWYGWIKVAPQNYLTTVQQMKKSKQFSILKSKTFYALKSKFFLKNKMKDTIKQLKDSLKDVAQDGAVLVKINNLPEEFPLSFILDLIQLSGGFLQDVQDIDIVDNFSADMVVKKRTAELFTNIEGYPHEQKQYIWLEVQSQKRPVRFDKLFNVEIDADYKPLIRETADVLALESSRQQIAKIYDKQQKFRLAIGHAALKKVLMFRGQTMNVVRIVRFQKKEEKKEEKK